MPTRAGPPATTCGLATALLCDPEILILDEPANGLDPEGVHWLRQLLRNLAAEGRTVLVSSHILAEVATRGPIRGHCDDQARPRRTAQNVHHPGGVAPRPPYTSCARVAQRAPRWCRSRGHKPLTPQLGFARVRRVTLAGAGMPSRRPGDGSGSP